MKCLCNILIEPTETQMPKLRRKERKGQKKRDFQIGCIKKVAIYIQPRTDLPEKVSTAINHYMIINDYNCHMGCVSKIWRAAPRDCSSAQRSPYWLALPHQEHLSKTKPRTPKRSGSTVHQGKCGGYSWGYWPVATWIEENCTITIPNSFSSEKFKFTNAIRFGKETYALSLQGTLAVVDSQQSTLKMSIVPGVKRAIPSSSSKGFREYLLELDGEMLLLFLVSRESMNVVDDIEMFRLDLTSKNGWVKKESIGDRILIVEHNCCRVFFPPPSDHYSRTIRGLSEKQYGIECPRNCIYFTLGPDAEWWVFDVGSRIMSAA